MGVGPIYYWIIFANELVQAFSERNEGMFVPNLNKRGKKILVLELINNIFVFYNNLKLVLGSRIGPFKSAGSGSYHE